MHPPSIDFRSIRPHHGSQHGGFEELVCQLAAVETPRDVRFRRKGVGADAGLECYRIEHAGSETGWQAKYFFTLGSSEVGQLTGSFENAVAKHPALARFVVCLPFDLSDGRVRGRKSEWDRWEDWVTARRSAASPRVVDIELWGGFELSERLSRSDPLHVGRRTYWFDLPHFGPDWLQDRFAVARAGLGRRYTPQLNVELPLRQALVAFARDPVWMCRFAAWADDLDQARHRSLRQIETALGPPHSADVATLSGQMATIAITIRTAALGPTDDVPLTEWSALVAIATATLDRCYSALWELAPRPKELPESARAGLHAAHELRMALDRVAEATTAPEIDFVNARHLLLTGEAGVGKSHLLADIAEHHVRGGFPAVLMLGGSFADAEPWPQICAQLGLTNITPGGLLGALDAAAEAAGTRALVIIDAVNERQGIAVWAERLAGFLAATDRFPHVATLISCRTTFVPYVIPHLDSSALPRLEHPGFAGRASEAARLYLDQRGIVRMAAPHLAPEFENPLFLRTCCDMLEARGEHELPRGLAGVSNIFTFYFSAVVAALNSRMGLNPRQRRVEAAIEALIDAMIAAETGYLPFCDADRILEDVHSSGNLAEQSLFTQLEHEGVLSVEPVSEGDTIIDMVRFTFERLSDHRIAQRLLDIGVPEGDPTAAFAVGGRLAHYVTGDDRRRFSGVMEAFAIQLPERFGVELIDAIGEQAHCWGLAHAFQLSLLWRRQDVFTDRTLQLVDDYLGRDAVLATLLAIATEPSNPFNADYVHRWLLSLGMPERDVHWSIPVAGLAEDNEGPVNTLIEWILANGLSEIDPARAHLAAIILAWFTSVSHRWVRDMATKALATLLVDRRKLAATLISHFAQVDDAYVVDRVLAAAYGAATRRWNNEHLGELATAAFAAVFAQNPLPSHALMRDHARSIIELAASRGALPANVSLHVARPPYPRGRPIEFIEDRTIDTYNEASGESLVADQICSSSVKNGDFARYKIDSLAGQFLRLPREEHGRSPDEIYQAWHAQAYAADPLRLGTLLHAIEIAKHSLQIAGKHVSPIDKANWWLDPARNDEWLRLRGDAERERDDAIKTFELCLSKQEVDEFRIRAAGHLRGPMWDDRARAWQPTYEGTQSRRWVAWRAHELGWTEERFGQFDRQILDRSRIEHRVERIGKKYQWIAYHELTGRLSDIALVDNHCGGLPEVYCGPWQAWTREMDPTILVTHTKHRRSEGNDSTWWSPHTSRWRKESPNGRIAWLEDRARDVPDPLKQIEVKDADGRRWLTLDIMVDRSQFVRIDGEQALHRTTWHKVTSLMVKREDAAVLRGLLTNRTRDLDHPRTIDMPYGGYLGEYPWHPAFTHVDGAWEVGEHRTTTVQATTAEWHVERSGHNYSIDESFNLTVPAPALMRGLGLRLAEGRSLAYADAGGNVVFKDPTADEPGFRAAVVDREAMLAFLHGEGLEILWVFTGEKMALGGRPHRSGWGGTLEYWGVYRFDGNEIKGTINFDQKTAAPEQMEEFLAHP